MRAILPFLLLALLGCEEKPSNSSRPTVSKEEGELVKREIARSVSMNELKLIAISQMDHLSEHGVYGTAEEINLSELENRKLSHSGWTFKIVLSPDRSSFCTIARPEGDGDWLYGDSDLNVKSLPPFEVDPETCKIKD